MLDRPAPIKTGGVKMGQGWDLSLHSPVAFSENRESVTSTLFIPISFQAT